MAVTIRSIARDCNVGIATVSRAINNNGSVRPEVRQLILKKVEELKWHPSSSATTLKTRKSYLIAVIVPGFTHHITRTMLHYLDKKLTVMGYQIIIHLENGNSDVGKLLKRQPDMAIVLNYNDNDGLNYKIRQLLDHDVKVIGAFGYSSFFPMACSDLHKVGYQTASMLIKSGHSRLALIKMEKRQASKLTYWTESVLAGVEQAMREHGFTFSRAENIIANNDEDVTNSLKNNNFTAYIAFTVKAQIRFYIQCRELGIEIPKQVSMMGIEGDDFLSAFNPPPSYFIHNYQAYVEIIEDFVRSNGKKSNGQYSVPLMYVPGKSVRSL